MIEGIASASTLFPAYLRALRTDPQVPFVEWTEEHGRNPDGRRFKFYNYQLAPASDLFNDAFEYVALRWFSGAGKTYLTAMAYAYGIDQLKLNIAKIFPSVGDSKEWFSEELMPILEAIPKIARIRMTKDNALLKKWVNGAVVRGRGFRSTAGLRKLNNLNVTDCDEIDAIDRTITDEGNPLTIAEARTRGSHFQAHWRTSYPSVVGESQIDNSIDRADECRWFYDCPKCRVAVYWQRSHIKWELGDVSTARVQCPECEQQFTEAQRLKSCQKTGHYRNRDGERVEPGSPPNPKYGNRRGYHLNCMAYQGPHDGAFPTYLAELAAKQEAADAADDPAGEIQVLRNTRDAESYESEFAAKPDPTDLEAARSHWDGQTLPDDVVAIYLGYDPGQQFQAVQVIGFGEKTVYPLLYEKILGLYDRPSTWVRVMELMRKGWVHPSGVVLRVSLACWDQKYQTEIVQKYARRVSNVICTRGSPSKDAPATGTIANGSPRVMATGPNQLKALVYDWVAAKDASAMSVEFSDVRDPDGFEMFNAAYFDGLLAEDRSEMLYRGRMVPIFTHDKKVRNEELDTFALCIAASRAHRFDYATTRALLEIEAAKLKRDKPEPVPRRKLGRSKTPWRR